MTKTQIDKLGDCLRKGNISEADLKMLDACRKSYGSAYENYEKLEAKILEASRSVKEKSREMNLKKLRGEMEELKREMIDLTKVTFKK